MLFRHNGVLFAPVSTTVTAAGLFYNFESPTFGHRRLHESNSHLVPDPINTRAVAPRTATLSPKAQLHWRGHRAGEAGANPHFEFARPDLIDVPLWANKVMGIPADHYIETPITAPVSLDGWLAWDYQQRHFDREGFRPR